eukprot:GHVS01025055.1.p1 GENE.GHVS01025055.1~~GHVS01025055.1.p1  ORF type:complete len:228 (-),score=27.50 GHVS01025055.1:446-1054(-)
MFQKLVIIDGRTHLLGRLASTIAKQILNGQSIVVVRCEEINISGSLYRNKLKYQKFLNLRMNTNPRRGPFHLRAPSKILWRAVRGMLPHKTARGQLALARLRSYDGMPPPFDRKKKLVVPSALRVLRLKPGRRYCRLGDMSSKVGWNSDELIERLECKRKARGLAFFEKKKETIQLKVRAKNMANKQITKDEIEFLQLYQKA